MYLWIQNSGDKVICLGELKWEWKPLNMEERPREIRWCWRSGKETGLKWKQNKTKLKTSYCNVFFFFSIRVIKPVSYIRDFLVPRKDYIFLSFIALDLVPYTSYSLNICCLIENKSKKETKPILLDQRKQTVSLWAWHRWVLFGPHCFFFTF